MADDAIIGSQATTPLDLTIAADEVAGKKIQRVKVQHGADGSATDTSAAAPFPVDDAAGSALLTSIDAGIPAALGANGGMKVEGVASGTPVPVSGSITVTGTMATSSAAASQSDGHSATLGSTTDAAATTTGSVIAQLRRIANLIAGTLTVSGTVTTTPPSNASTNLAQVAGATTATGSGTAAGALRVELPTNGTGVVGLATGSNTIGALTANQTVNNAQVAGTAVDVNSGNKSAGTQRVILATDQPQLTNALKVDGSAVTQPVSSELGTGLTTFSNTALSNTKTAVKASAGKVYGWMVHNPSAATAFIQVWNVAIGSITVGTTAPTWTIPLPAGASANVFTDRGVTHSTEINVAATTTATGSTAPATALVVSLFYI